MHALKGLVFALGMLILISFGLIIYGFATKLSRMDAKEDGVEEAVEPVAAAPAFGEVRVSLPQGCSIDEILPNGRRLYLRLGPVETCNRILVLDGMTGRQVGAIQIDR